MKMVLLWRSLSVAVCLFGATGSPACPEPAGGITICGKVSLPDGRPASRVGISISGRNGFTASTNTDDQGSYCFESIPPTFFTLTVNPPPDAKFVAEPARLDATTGGPTFTVNIFTKYPLENTLPKERPAPSISATEAGQRIPKGAKKALDKAQKYREEKKFDDAIAELDKAIEIYPGYFQALAERGVVLIQSGHPEKALPDFDKSMQIFPDYEPALSGAGYCLLTSGQFDRSVALLEKAVGIEPSNAKSQMFLGIAHLALSHWQKAQEALERALKLDPSGAVSAHIYLGDALAAQHLYARAAEELHTYLQLNPGAPNADRLRSKEAHWRSLVN
jgi:tetratricopeptide (TPR) repeat protein